MGNQVPESTNPPMSGNDQFGSRNAREIMLKPYQVYFVVFEF